SRRGSTVRLVVIGVSVLHYLVIDNSMRPLFSYLRMRVMPVGVYAATEDWGATDRARDSQTTKSNASYLSQRISQAGGDLAEVTARLDPRPRRAPSQPKELEVTPFDQLLHGTD